MCVKSFSHPRNGIIHAWSNLTLVLPFRLKKYIYIQPQMCAMYSQLFNFKNFTWPFLSLTCNGKMAQFQTCRLGASGVLSCPLNSQWVVIQEYLHMHESCDSICTKHQSYHREICMKMYIEKAKIVFGRSMCESLQHTTSIRLICENEMFGRQNSYICIC